MAYLTPRRPAGFGEFLPQDQLLFQKYLQTIQTSYESFGFTPIETPAIEYADVLLAKGGGETEKEMYQFQKGDNQLALHFDLTVPTARYVAEHRGELTFPLRRYQIQKSWRAEKAQKGRAREFYQADIDVLGRNSRFDDAEMVHIIEATLRKLEVPNFTVHINHRLIINGMLQYLGLEGLSTEIIRLIDKRDKQDHASLQAEMEELGVSAEITKQLFQMVSFRGTARDAIEYLKQMEIDNESFCQGVQEMQDIISIIQAMSLPQESYVVDLSIMRGLDYYTGVVYETTLDNYPQFGSVCSGGRYDNLVGYYADVDISGVGISIGITRLFDRLKQEGLLESDRQVPSQFLVVRFSQEGLVPALEIAKKLRENECSVEVYPEAEKIKKQFKYAHKKSIPYVILADAQETSGDHVLVKNMQTGEQQCMSFFELSRL